MMTPHNQEITMYNLDYPIIGADTYKEAFQKVTQELQAARKLYSNVLAIASGSPTQSNIDAATKAALDVATATSNFLKVRANMLELRAAEVEANDGKSSVEVGETTIEKRNKVVTGFDPSIRIIN